MDGDDANIGWYTTPEACELTESGAKCLALNSAELTITPEVDVTNVQSMVLQLAGPTNLIIAAATWDTNLESNSEDNTRPHCTTSQNTVTCSNVQEDLSTGDSISFWFKFAFADNVSVTGTVKFFDADGHELANFALQAVPTILNDNAGDVLAFNANEGEFVRTWDRNSDEASCGPMGLDSGSQLTWTTTADYQGTGDYQALWHVISNPALGLTTSGK